MLIDLKGKTAIVTGGSDGIGRAIAARLAASGANVAMVARGEAMLEEAAQDVRKDAIGQVQGFAGDVTDSARMGEIVAAVSGAFGGVEILVNNAGSSSRIPFLELSRGEMVADLDLKLLAAVNLAQLVIPAMKEKRSGRILNV